jgi:putative redox protein
MSTRHHIARATASTGSALPAWRVDIDAGPDHLVADEPSSGGGGGAGPSPFGLVTSGLAACTAMTLRMYAVRKGWDLTRIEVDVRYDVDDESGPIFERTITVPNDLDPEHRQRLSEIAERTPVTLALRNGTPIATHFLSVDT